MKVFKYQIEPADYITITMPANAKILTVQMQGNVPCIWALVDPDAPLVKRVFRWAGTGHYIDEPENKLVYINTFQMLGGTLIFHLFEVL